MKFGDYLKKLRTERGWTQPEAASRAGIEQSYLSKLENGKSIPSSDIYKKLVDIYDIQTRDMAGVLFPAELDRLRGIDSLREILLENARARQAMPRRWLIAGLAALVVGGGFVGLSRVEEARTVQQFIYQSDGVILPDESSDIFANLDEEPNPAVERVVDREKLLRRLDERTQVTQEMRGPEFTERTVKGRRVWRLVGGAERLVPAKYRWALVPGLALIAGGLGCFFLAWRWR